MPRATVPILTKVQRLLLIREVLQELYRPSGCECHTGVILPVQN